MKLRIFLLSIFFLFTQLSSFALQEVVLEADDTFSINAVSTNETVENTTPQELTLFEKIENIKAKEISDTSTSLFLLEDVLTKEFENGPIETAHLFGYYRGGLYVDMDSDDIDTHYDFNSINVGLNGKFRGSKTYYDAWFRVSPQHQYGFLQYLPSNMYIANKSIPHHTIMFGNSRTATGIEGGLSMTQLPFVTRSQIGRNIGNVRKVGLRVKGNYDLIEYDLGGYDSDSYFRKFFPGAEFAGWVNLKPLGKTDGKYGKLKLGGGITAGHNDINYCVTGAYAGYEYKRISADFEYASANGYNGGRGLSVNHAEGFYTTLGYKITPKLQAVARYDQFTPNKAVSNDIRREYSTGLNWFIKGQALKVMLNYVFCQNDIKRDSHRIILGTQILL